MGCGGRGESVGLSKGSACDSLLHRCRRRGQTTTCVDRPIPLPSLMAAFVSLLMRIPESSSCRRRVAKQKAKPPPRAQQDLIGTKRLHRRTLACRQHFILRLVPVLCACVSCVECVIVVEGCVSKGQRNRFRAVVFLGEHVNRSSFQNTINKATTN